MGRRKIYQDPVDRRRERYKAKQRAEYEDYKASCRCAICGAQDPEGIEFYDPAGTGKIHNFGRRITQGHSWKTVQREIIGTVPLCRPCADGVLLGTVHLPDQAVETAALLKAVIS